MRANHCRVFCVEKDLSQNKLIFKPVLKDCHNCEFLKKRLLDKELEEFIEAERKRKEENKCDQP